jgi:hypothetical protein
VADEDRRGVELGDDGLQVLDDRRDGDLRDRRRVGAERLHLDLEAGVGRREHAVALGLVVRDPVLPGTWRDPEAMDEDDGLRCGAHGRLLSRSDPPAGRIGAPDTEPGPSGVDCGAGNELIALL